MKTLKFYFQTTLEAIVLLLFMSAAVAVIHFVSDQPQPKYPSTLNLKPEPGVSEFAKYKQPFRRGTL